MPKANSSSSSSSSSNYNIFRQDENGRSSLWHACHDGNAEQVRFFLNNEALINTSDADGCTPLMIACANGHINIVEILLSHNATIEHNSSAELISKNSESYSSNNSIYARK